MGATLEHGGDAVHQQSEFRCKCRFAVHLSLLALYGLGGWLVSNQLMPIRTLLSAIGFTFSLVFATQGVVQTFSDARRALVSLRRCVWQRRLLTVQHHLLRHADLRDLLQCMSGMKVSRCT